MRSKNSRPIDASEAQYLADVKSCACVVCDAPPPSAAHHVEQGLHYLTAALCWDDHQGAQGWHGDKSRWHAAKMTTNRALNETRRRVDDFRASGRQVVTSGRQNGVGTRLVMPEPSRASSRTRYKRSMKIVPRADD